ncbi:MULTISPECIES: xanthine dehydrogenase family protein molybdopterin-binding subunit [Clostridium]|uniref:Xanthine dehydrogenase related protein, molybdopterin binding protein n=2 Tax=Clostridium TaxID=1485 RepID=D8GPG4_CLOLD|nr:MULTISPECIES: xanthine dehydrogenase family protein molybdopterin-binding subunit [Clostridium]ADK16042.1 xanthine dehydrogenase related protein, molybdopterin binding protein [Clostridium ljungdahlii DSM 13528]AGY75218.1 xanthine dehydrogenase family protein molybdopterin-binding subunit [Clostridium autoethanogenum DSM 10061]ALU35388.1 putative xanthine dehydrogenase [Clostridium autoethanogenum DSM 10061]OAA87082.1 putative xanthine dehydrogenase subunit D [Clostridium ljungdahlii DSM 135
MENNISDSIIRFDAEEKISGKAKYISDIVYKDVLYAKTLRSTRARAKILSIKFPEIPEGYFIVDKNDVPGKIGDWPIFVEDEVNYIGEGILLVVGPEKKKVVDIILRTEVEYEDLPSTLTMDDAEEKNDTFVEYKYSKGDIEAAVRDAKYVFENEYSTGYQEHAYMEPQGIVGTYHDGKITVEGSMQCPYYIKDAIVQALDFDYDKVQVKQATTGGGFGGKEEFPSLLGCQVAVASYKIKKTVKLVFERNEDIKSSTKRHPSKIKLKGYIDENYRIIGMDAYVRLDGGAYSGLSNVVLQRAIFGICGVYDVANVKTKGSVLKTNKLVSGAFRGFGAPQSTFAVEMFVEYMANKLKINPVEFRKINYVKKGSKTSTGGTYREDVVVDKLTDKVEEMSDYNRKYKEYMSENKLKGIGMSVFFHGGGFTGKGERDIIKTKLKVRKNKNDTVEILVSNVEMGQGLGTTLRKIAAETIGIPIDRIIYNKPDTDRVPNSGPTVASRSILIVGKLIEEACQKIKDKWDEKDEFEIAANYKHPEEILWDENKFEGDAYNTSAWGANVVEVEIDPLTYEVLVKGIWTAYDVGNAIDDNIVKGQIDGGVTQGLGYASMEVLKPKQGKLEQSTFTDYIIPTAVDFPRIHRELVNSPYYNGPFGGKSVGELTIDGAAPAYAIAVENALKRHLNQIPVTPESIMEVMDNEGKL